MGPENVKEEKLPESGIPKVKNHSHIHFSDGKEQTSNTSFYSDQLNLENCSTMASSSIQSIDRGTDALTNAIVVDGSGAEKLLSLQDVNTNLVPTVFTLADNSEIDLNNLAQVAAIDLPPDITLDADTLASLKVTNAADLAMLSGIPVAELDKSLANSAVDVQSFEAVDSNSIPLLSLSENQNDSSMYTLLDMLENGNILSEGNQESKVPSPAKQNKRKPRTQSKRSRRKPVPIVPKEVKAYPNINNLNAVGSTEAVQEVTSPSKSNEIPSPAEIALVTDDPSKPIENDFDSVRLPMSKPINKSPIILSPRRQSFEMSSVIKVETPDIEEIAVDDYLLASENEGGISENDPFSNCQESDPLSNCQELDPLGSPVFKSPTHSLQSSTNDLNIVMDNTVKVSVNQIGASLSQILEKLQKCDTVVLKKTDDISQIQKDLAVENIKQEVDEYNVVIIPSKASNGNVLSVGDVKRTMLDPSGNVINKATEIDKLSSKLVKCNTVLQKTVPVDAANNFNQTNCDVNVNTMLSATHFRDSTRHSSLGKPISEVRIKLEDPVPNKKESPIIHSDSVSLSSDRKFPVIRLKKVCKISLQRLYMPKGVTSIDYKLVENCSRSELDSLFSIFYPAQSKYLGGESATRQGTFDYADGKLKEEIIEETLSDDAPLFSDSENDLELVEDDDGSPQELDLFNDDQSDVEEGFSISNDIDRLADSIVCSDDSGRSERNDAVKNVGDDLLFGHSRNEEGALPHTSPEKLSVNSKYRRKKLKQSSLHKKYDVGLQDSVPVKKTRGPYRKSAYKIKQAMVLHPPQSLRSKPKKSVLMSNIPNSKFRFNLITDTNILPESLLSKEDSLVKDKKDQTKADDKSQGKANKNALLKSPFSNLFNHLETISDKSKTPKISSVDKESTTTKDLTVTPQKSEDSQSFPGEDAACSNREVSPEKEITKSANNKLLGSPEEKTSVSSKKETEISSEKELVSEENGISISSEKESSPSTEDKISISPEKDKEISQEKVPPSENESTVTPEKEIADSLEKEIPISSEKEMGTGKEILFAPEKEKSVSPEKDFTFYSDKSFPESSAYKVVVPQEKEFAVPSELLNPEDIIVFPAVQSSTTDIVTDVISNDKSLQSNEDTSYFGSSVFAIGQTTFNKVQENSFEILDVSHEIEKDSKEDVKFNCSLIIGKDSSSSARSGEHPIEDPNLVLPGTSAAARGTPDAAHLITSGEETNIVGELPVIDIQNDLELASPSTTKETLASQSCKGGEILAEDSNVSMDSSFAIDDSHFDPEYELPDDFNPFDLEFSALEESSSRSGVNGSELHTLNEDQFSVPLASAMDLASAVRDGTDQFVKDSGTYNIGDRYGSHADSGRDDPSYMNFFSDLSCPNCDFKSKSRKEYQSHIASQCQTRISTRKRTKTDYYEAEEFPAAKSLKPSKRGRGRGRGRGYQHTYQSRSETNPSNSTNESFNKLMFEVTQKDFKLVPKESFDIDSGRKNSPGHTEWHPASDGKKEYMVYCAKCSYVTDNLNEFRRHVLVHNVNSLCTICNHRYTSQQDFVEHKEAHLLHTRSKFSCSLCSFSTTNQRFLDVHKSAHKVFRKGGEKYLFKKRQQTVTNRQLPRLVKLKCPTCNYVTLSSVSYKAHLKTHAQLIKKDCIHCDFSTEDDQLYQTHLRSHQPVGGGSTTGEVQFVRL